MKSTDLANVNFTFGRHLKLVDLDWTSFENCNGKFNGIDNIEIFRMSGVMNLLLSLIIIETCLNLNVILVYV
jgi:hypothetical protein